MYEYEKKVYDPPLLLKFTKSFFNEPFHNCIFFLFIVCPQYYQLKYGFKAVIHEHQLKKLEIFFKPDLFQVSPVNFKIQPFSNIKWENVGYQNLDGGIGSTNIACLWIWISDLNSIHPKPTLSGT